MPCHPSHEGSILTFFGPAFVVAESSSREVAFAVAGVEVASAKAGWLLDVAVLPKFRAKGIGATLCGRVIEVLERSGVRLIRATVSPENQPSIKRLTRVRFSVKDDLDNYFGDGQRRLVMERRKDGLG